VVLEHLRYPTSTYIEPFAGGCAVALSLPERVRCAVSDAEADLIAFYVALRSRPLSVAQRVQALAEAHSSEAYYDVRDRSVARGPVWRAARFLYLNKACFNGLHRKNRAGRFNVPIGRGTLRVPGAHELYDAACQMRRWQLRCESFEHAIGRASRGDVIYADPPYDGTFTKYTDARGFGQWQQVQLSGVLHAAWKRGVTVVSTNADTPLIRELYAWASYEPITETRRIAANGNRADAPCLLISAIATR
jgi:DNA adenine methylase